MANEKLHLTAPGEIILEEFIKPLGLTQKEAARGLDIPESRLSELINGKLRINVEYALRLSLFFGMDEKTWLNLQYDYDMRVLEKNKARLIRKRVKPASKLYPCCA